MRKQIEVYSPDAKTTRVLIHATDETPIDFNLTDDDVGFLLTALEAALSQHIVCHGMRVDHAYD